MTYALTTHANANKVHNRNSFCIFNLLMIEGAQDQIPGFIAELQFGQLLLRKWSSLLRGDHRLPARVHRRGACPGRPPSCAPSFARESLRVCESDLGRLPERPKSLRYSKRRRSA